MNPIKVIARFDHFSLLLPWTSTITIVTTLISYLPTPLLVHGTHSTPSSGYSLSFDCPASPSLISNFHAVFPKCLMTNILLTLALTSSGASLLTSGFFSGAFIFHTTRGGVSCWTWSFESRIVLKLFLMKHLRLQLPILGAGHIRCLHRQHHRVHQVFRRLRRYSEKFWSLACRNYHLNERGRRVKPRDNKFTRHVLYVSFHLWEQLSSVAL